MITELTIKTRKQGLHDVTADLESVVAKSSTGEGLCTLFLQHTSASLLIQENYDVSAKNDLESWMNRLVPELDPLYTHTAEGKDDMPAHIKAALTASSISVPYLSRKLCLGTWQGIFLWEHRHNAHQRKIIVHLSED